ncbi:hypothetical protein Cp1R7AA1_032 [Mesorhizobium phage Cp1R7A-A1]|nr:hypothetical protein Cp1R7AA1_032 [Mesorhizobium phage Cp1R7A-A1]
MARNITVELDTRKAEAITLWLYEVDLELMDARPRLTFHRHIAVLMHYMAHGWTPAQAAKAVAELYIGRAA